jgi:hypothetical protein
MTNMNICACMYRGIFVHVCTKTTLVFLSIDYTTLVYYFHVFFFCADVRMYACSMYVCSKDRKCAACFQIASLWQDWRRAPMATLCWSACAEALLQPQSFQYISYEK